ncbi:hypothetical protein LSPH24S_03564 [Lysinibacillus sphaericus]
MSKKEYDLLKQQLAQNPIVEMTNYIFSVYYEDINNNLSLYQGKKIRLSGFVLKETDLLENQFVISRFLITHCVADASIIGFLTEMPEAASLQEDSWIEAEGTIDMVTIMVLNSLSFESNNGKTYRSLLNRISIQLTFSLVCKIKKTDLLRDRFY